MSKMIADDPFGAHGGSAVPAERSAKARKLSSKIAKGLSAEAAPEKPTRRGSEQKKAVPSGLSQDEMQRKIEVLMANPKLWQEFKQYLAESNVKGSTGTQRALREFIEKNEEIAAEADAAIQEEHTKRTSGLGRSLLGAVNSLTSELEAEEAAQSLSQQTLNISSAASTGTSRVASAARSSFSSASNMGMNFLRKAGEVATSSISGLDKEAEEAVEANESCSNASSLSMSMNSLDFNTSSADFVGVLNEWFGDEKIGDIQEENDQEVEETESEPEGKE